MVHGHWNRPVWAPVEQVRHRPVPSSACALSSRCAIPGSAWIRTTSGSVTSGSIAGRSRAASPPAPRRSARPPSPSWSTRPRAWGAIRAWASAVEQAAVGRGDDGLVGHWSIRPPMWRGGPHGCPTRTMVHAALTSRLSVLASRRRWVGWFSAQRWLSSGAVAMPVEGGRWAGYCSKAGAGRAGTARSYFAPGSGRSCSGTGVIRTVERTSWCCDVHDGRLDLRRRAAARSVCSAAGTHRSARRGRRRPRGSSALAGAAGGTGAARLSGAERDAAMS